MPTNSIKIGLTSDILMYINIMTHSLSTIDLINWLVVVPNKVKFSQWIHILFFISYGLLGPSGCGKTTLLRCLIGRIKPDQGYVRIFGFQPNEPGSQIPGQAIGYMPQVCASVSWLLWYFGSNLFNIQKPRLSVKMTQFLCWHLGNRGLRRLHYRRNASLLRKTLQTRPQVS